MNNKDHKKIKKLFNAALEKEPGERERFLSEECGDDVELRHEIESLLSVYESSESFMEEPLVGSPARNLRLKKGDRIRHYEIIKKIGRGGMGEVYLAMDSQLSRKVALKLLAPEFTGDRERLNRFEQEARTVSALDHPCILTLFESGESDEGRHFISTEYVRGETLKEHCLHSNPGLEKKLDIAIQIASALAAAHEAGVIHRDIKPENIIIRPDGYIKVLDFGIAKLSEPSAVADGLNVDGEKPTRPMIKTDTGLIMGTAPYMSPEQANGIKVDARTDIWSLGVVLYEMLTGVRPFGGDTPTETIIEIIQKEPPLISSFNTEFAAEFDWLFEKTFCKEPEGRYQTADELRNDLKKIKQKIEFEKELENSKTSKNEKINRIDEHTSNTSQPTFRGENIVNWIKAHKLGTLLILAILVSGVAFTVYFLNFNSKVAGNEDSPIRSIAVLPFENASQDSNNEYLSDGLTESIINRLSRLEKLKVLPRSSVFRYKERLEDPQKIGNELKVDAVLTGKVIQRGDKLQIQTELIEVASGKQLWGERDNRPLSELLDIEESIAKEITNKLRLKLTGAEKEQLAKRYTEDNEAYQAYQRGRFHWERRNEKEIKKGIEQFQKAIELDPNFALAWSGLADSYVFSNEYGSAPKNEIASKAKSAAEKAVELGPDLAETHTSLGYVFFGLEWDFVKAEKHFRKAIELNPKYALARRWYSVLLFHLWRKEEALNQGHLALQAEPLSEDMNAYYAQCLVMVKRYNEAIEHFQKNLELYPDYRILPLLIQFRPVKERQF